MSGLLQDVRYSVRQLRKNPGFTLFAIVIMALGISATTAMFSVIDAVLLKPLAYRDPQRLVILGKQITPVRFEEMKAGSRSYSGLGAYAGIIEEMALSGNGAPEVLNGARVSANFLQVLGIAPLRGRSFLDQEDKPGAPGVALISEKLWERRFGRDSKFVGKTINLAGTSHTVIGILPAGFQFPFAGLDVWVARPSELSRISVASRPISPTLRVFGRLKQQITVQQANAELVVLKSQYAAGHPGMLDAKANAPESLLPLKDEVVSDIRPKLWMLFGAVGLLLLIVCANVGGLMLARAMARHREFAVRVAIGAGRGHIIRQLLTDSILLASAGGALGIALAVVGLNAIRSVTFVDLPRAAEIHLDGFVLGFAVALSVLTGLVFGLAPSLIALRPDLADVLRGSSGGGASSRTGAHFGPRQLLVTGQVALSIVLLIGTTLLIESLAHLARVDPGFQTANLLTMHISLSPARYDTDEKQAVFYEQVVEQVESLPGVRSAAVSHTLPFTGWGGAPVQLAQGQPMKLNERPISIFQLITPKYFRTMSIPLKRGREFDAHDNLRSAPVVIINESLARHFWPEYPGGTDPIGQRMLMGNNRQPLEIVGISADIREVGKDEDPRLELYLPSAQAPNRSASLIVRTNSNPLTLAGAIQKQVLTIDPEQPVSDVATMDEVEESSEGQLRLLTMLLGGFAGVATLLATVGLYGVISYSVAQRTKEIGIRQALGAQRGDILALVVGQGLGLSVSGVFVGVCAACGLTRFLKDVLFEVGATDPGTFAAMAILFVLLASLASYIPARRATKVDPMVALRYE